jgi:ATPases with chaperone activity, ATP-binding subunit
LELSKEAKTYITSHGYDPIYGARPLKRFLQKHVETLVAKMILGGKVEAGSTIKIDLTNGELNATL